MEKRVKIYPLQKKKTPGWGYWGNYGEIDMGFSVSYVGEKDKLHGDKLHYHKKGVIYMITLGGEGLLEVDGEEVVMKKDTLIRIEPRVKYRHIGVSKRPFRWITICSSKDPDDKVVVE